MDFTPLYSQPNLNDSIQIAGIGASGTQPQALPNPKGQGFTNQRKLWVCNTSGVWVFINLGTEKMTAATAAKGMGIPPNWGEPINIQPDVTHISAVAPTGTGSLQVTSGVY